MSSYRKNNYYIGFDNYSYIDFNWTYILYRFKIRQIKTGKPQLNNNFPVSLRIKLFKI